MLRHVTAAYPPVVVVVAEKRQRRGAAGETEVEMGMETEVVEQNQGRTHAGRQRQKMSGTEVRDRKGLVQ